MILLKLASTFWYSKLNSCLDCWHPTAELPALLLLVFYQLRGPGEAVQVFPNAWVLYPQGDPGGVPALAALGWPSLSHFCSLESEPADGIVLFPCHSAFQIQLSWWERKNIKTTE